MKLITNVNPKRTPINWEDFLSLCKAAGLTPGKPDSQGRLKFYKAQTEIMHQVIKSKDGKLKMSGWFSLKFSSGETWQGHALTAGGQVCILETINTLLPMNTQSQQAFAAVVDHVYQTRLASGK